jgi:hypothetical protein
VVALCVAGPVADEAPEGAAEPSEANRTALKAAVNGR